MAAAHAARRASPAGRCSGAQQPLHFLIVSRLCCCMPQRACSAAFTSEPGAGFSLQARQADLSASVRAWEELPLSSGQAARPEQVGSCTSARRRRPPPVLACLPTPHPTCLLACLPLFLHLQPNMSAAAALAGVPQPAAALPGVPLPQQLMIDGPLPAGAPASIRAALAAAQQPARSQGVYASPTGLAGVQVRLLPRRLASPGCLKPRVAFCAPPRLSCPSPPCRQFGGRMVCPPTLSLRTAHIAADLALLWWLLRDASQQAQQGQPAGAAGGAAPSPVTPAWRTHQLNFPEAAYATDAALHQQLAALEAPQLTAFLQEVLPRPVPLALPPPDAAAAAAAAARSEAPAAGQAQQQQRQLQAQGKQPGRKQKGQQGRQPPAKRSRAAADTTGR